MSEQNKIDSIELELIEALDERPLNLHKIKSLLDNLDVNIIKKNGSSLLRNAIILHKAELALLLIDMGADVNEKSDEDDTTLLYEACDFIGEPMIPIVKALIDAGANVNDTSFQHVSLLMHASYPSFYHPEIFRILIDTNIDVNVTNDDGSNPLFYAFMSFSGEIHYDCIRTLIDCGADVNHRNKHGANIMSRMCSVRCPNLNVAKLLIDCSIDVNVPSEEGMSPLFLVVQKCDDSYFDQMIGLLIDGGVNLDQTNKDKQNIYQYAHSINRYDRLITAIKKLK